MKVKMMMLVIVMMLSILSCEQKKTQKELIVKKANEPLLKETYKEKTNEEELLKNIEKDKIKEEELLKKIEINSTTDGEKWYNTPTVSIETQRDMEKWAKERLLRPKRKLNMK